MCEIHAMNEKTEERKKEEVLKNFSSEVMDVFNEASTQTFLNKRDGCICSDIWYEITSSFTPIIFLHPPREP
jgi:hypothetical protein